MIETVLSFHLSRMLLFVVLFFFETKPGDHQTVGRQHFQRFETFADGFGGMQNRFHQKHVVNPVAFSGQVRADAVAAVQPLIDVLSSQHFYLGPVGSASRFKLVHNLLLGLHRAVLAEGLVFAETLGFDAATALDILAQTPAVSGVMKTKGRKMAESDFTTQAKLSQHLKDVRLIVEAADRGGAAAPLSELHQTLLEKAENLGFGDADNSAVIQAFRACEP